VQSRHKDVYWFGHEWPYVQWVLLLLMLPCTGVLIVGVTNFSREGADPRSLLGCVCCADEVCSIRLCLFLLFLDVAPTTPFIASKGRAQVTFVVKR
jgi:hypothetical protein